MRLPSLDPEHLCLLRVVHDTYSMLKRAKKIPGLSLSCLGPGMPFSILEKSSAAAPNPRGAEQICCLSGLPAPGSSNLPRLPVRMNSGVIAALVPGYGGGSATDFNRLPCYERWTVEKSAVDVNRFFAKVG